MDVRQDFFFKKHNRYPEKYSFHKNTELLLRIPNVKKNMFEGLFEYA